ncbi:DUF6446 family protein [Thetidibacter halocola]|uniref:Histidine kinase n=1 Tax=Thetidibacter halocola TaxID=2827239 RepID=A0A8J7WBK3_9RHOB|nr:DUF6446 family protein [Thetidibacter halocola]MBS0124540.1 histidine kinase [Thetidibacter halocola]
MTGKFLAGIIVACSLIAGIAIYYLQVYYFYETLPPQASITLTGADGAPVELAVTGFEGIDADSSPIRYRACFDVALSLDEATARLDPYQGSEPRTAPGWFTCFDAEAIGDRIEAGTARVFAVQRNLEFGIDRVIAITDDGRGYVWHEINDCGDKAYDGSPLGDDCPPREGN